MPPRFWDDLQQIRLEGPWEIEMTTAPKPHAPVAVFAYERLDHLEKTINALQANDGAKATEMYVYSDGARNHNAERVESVRRYLRSLDGFKKVNLVEHDQNIGLAANIKSGISNVFTEHDRIIVLEDDIVTSPNFLLYMNAALQFYERNGKVGHINAWTYPLSEKCREEFYFLDMMNCWGWATWKDTWSAFNDDAEHWENVLTWVEKNRIDLDGSGEFWPQVTSNIRGKKKTWAIFWFLSLVESGLLSLTPRTSFCQNIGHDGSGENSRATDKYLIDELNSATDFRFPSSPVVDERMRKNIERFIKNRNPFAKRVVKKLRSFTY